MNRKSLCATFYVYCEEQLEFIRLDAILAPAALYPQSFESFSVVLFGVPAAADIFLSFLYRKSE